MNKINFLITILLISITMSSTAQNLEYKVYRADENSFHIASVLIYGEKDAVLIDAQFTLSDAHNVVAEILKSGKNLTTIYISHGDPDYYFGLEVFKNSFPDATIYTSKHTLSHIKKTYEKKLQIWGPKLGSNGTKKVVFPQVLEGNTIDLEGHSIEIKGLNGPTPERTFVWIPSLKAIVGGVNVYDNLHLWIADASTTEKRVAWLSVLEEMEHLNPEIVVSAHALDNSNLNRNAITYSKNYLIAYQKEEVKSKNSEELIAAMQKLYPNAGLGIALQLGAKVAKGEMKW
ncbi:glyoxylase-like metal-dependent hydrolase (beta-lactamase superfamily II) [Aquimarina sp. EL_43]|uniref:MBL fold metallo-hydrolase n=1 Tax=Aquimarina TaxID=290174 RepID=UPI000470E423|nr:MULTISPECIES: MBL fold metallo-hydrolase [Aquimarina]MBG6132866.1 glyoxylase-like metal-dependent hydrolase (beta-lactamase superfamily II) [Aquimarina sp. EL_35]MBG6153057.1 glyoxylase-like metal-dependent hydrolase (beta-lactamase superfamily II) [Aquimarina sp. EL_32]MBG6171213.1 glyoxylase-like metal-dependent hydrolase (beta-lactamase superfamily II) [Aquimarina sp. EL_43]